MWLRLLGLLLVLIGIWQLYAAYRAFKSFRKRANHLTTILTLFGLWTGLLFGVIVLILGGGLLLGLIDAAQLATLLT